MVSAAPYTRNKNQWGGGYNYNSTEILGFAQIHGWIMSGINLMPTTGDVDPTRGEQGWKSKFTHDGEIMEPGYQRVYLERYDVEAGEQLQVKIAISYTSLENARNNLATECNHWDFAQVRQGARDQWNEWLGRIQFEGGTREQKVKFYTDLWHTLLGRHRAYQKGLLRLANADHAYDVMKRNHMPGGMMGVNEFHLSSGWNPGRAGATVQWAFEDWALAQMAAVTSATPTSPAAPAPMCSTTPASPGSPSTGCGESTSKPMEGPRRTPVTVGTTKIRGRWAGSVR
jgi:putative alpha-1,2-mannosidase